MKDYQTAFNRVSPIRLTGLSRLLYMWAKSPSWELL